MLRRVSDTLSNGRSARGFTLIELLVALAVAAVLITVGIPSFASFMANQRTKTASQELFSDLLYARSEAIKRNEQVTVNRNATWSDGWTITSVDLDGNAITLREHQAFEQIQLDDGSGNTPVSSVTFDRTGRLVGGGSPSFGFCVSGDSDHVTHRLVTIDLSGRASIKRDGDC
jgi:type IV fimbrial biogenesis protein FimT